MTDAFDAYHEWLGIAPKDQPPNHYRLLGVDLFETKAATIEHAADQRMALLRTFQAGRHSALSQRLLNEVAAARLCLLKPERRAAYDAALRKQLAAQDEEALDSGLTEALRQAQAEKAAPAGDSAGKSARKLRLLAGVGSAALIGVLLVSAWLAMRRAKPEVALRREATAPQQPAPAVKGPAPAEPNEPRIPAKPAIKRESAEPASKPPQENPAPPPAAPAPAPAPIPNSQSPTPNPQSPTPAKQPLPAGPALEQATKAAAALFQADMDKATTAADKLALAKRLLTQAADPSGDAPCRYALLRIAGELAVGARDAETAFACVDRIDAVFEIDRLAMKTAILAAWAKEARSTDSRKWLVEHLLAVGDEALDAGNVNAARESGKLATGKSVGLRDKEIVQRFKMFRQRLAEAGKDAEELQQAQTQLAKDAGHKPSNLIVGRYLCFTKGDWKKGLPLLALGSDATLKRLAEQELKSPPTQADDQLALAEVWWEIAQDCRRSQANTVRGHAGQWYQQAFAALPAGPLRSNVEKRLAALKRLRGQQTPPLLAVAPFDAREAAAYQERWAAYLGKPVVMTNSIGMKLILIPPGEFDMGSAPEEMAWAVQEGKKNNESSWYFDPIPWEGPRHRVKISRPYYLGVYFVTQGEYERVMGVNPSAFCAKPMNPSAFRPPLPPDAAKLRPGDAMRIAGRDTRRHPVDTVSWDDAVEFCRRLSDLPEERGAKRLYRLPTEAEWEYACRAGTTTHWWCGNDEAALPECAWYVRNAGSMTHPVGEKRANPWGLFDMYGQLWQWCMDWCDDKYYEQSPGMDPAGPQKGWKRAYRGGYFDKHGRYSAYRGGLKPDYRNHYLGLRVCVGGDETSK
jgi:formylglycine-generating enzyme required for sulfatase activity/outer membrane biosynthesis protein TonB